ncbi:MAG: hypothetical protein CM1200mP39_31080 [Dehalococcoidia bacterium]|nr:MAG: hypothetical protein CM1200mP39_31080 [Dehalococcoidia bacterium]
MALVFVQLWVVFLAGLEIRVLQSRVVEAVSGVNSGKIPGFTGV